MTKRIVLFSDVHGNITRIDNVLNGKVIVKLSFKEKLKYIIDKIFNTF